LNNIVIKGRLTKDVELRTTTTGKEVANTSVAVTRRFGAETDFFDIQAWSKTGIFLNTYFKKGQEIVVQGSMQCRKWQDKENNNRYSWELIAEQVGFCGSKSDSNNSAPATYSPSAPLDVASLDVTVDDEDLPF